jgi:hypothetical protein
MQQRQIYKWHLTRGKGGDWDRCTRYRHFYPVSLCSSNRAHFWYDYAWNQFRGIGAQGWVSHDWLPF